MVSLSKNQTVSLNKTTGQTINELSVGLGWDPAQPPQQEKGFFSKIFNPSRSNDSIDLDASCILLDQQHNEIESIYFRQLTSACGSVRHQGDNLTGDGDGDDEVIQINLGTLKSNVHHLAIIVNSYRGQTFNEVDNAFCRLFNNEAEICRYQLSEKGPHTGILIASFTRKGNDWNFTAHGLPCRGQKLHDMLPDIREALTSL